MTFTQTWRWFGPGDPISLAQIKQTGALGIVTALHHVPNGDVWSVKEITERKELIEAAGLKWAVVESVPVHEDIKKGKGDQYIDNYKQSLLNLGLCGIKRVCYNFMPVLDWSRTDLDFRHADGTSGLRFDAIALAAFDLYILCRDNAEYDYNPNIITKAEQYFKQLTVDDTQRLTANILAGLPGAEEHFSLNGFKLALEEYNGIGQKELKDNLFNFLKNIIPAAEEAGVLMCIHPDDPPFSLFGLPRIVSSETDIQDIYNSVDSIHNGLTFCTGSLAAAKENDLIQIVKKFADRIHFLHLRNIRKEEHGSFHESGHLTGDADMYKIMKELIFEQQLRKKNGRDDYDIPFRPDHGLLMLTDAKERHNPGYSLIGRLCGLAEIRALEAGIRRALIDS